MDLVASRDLRNHTADVLRRVADGSRVGVTVHGKVVAEIGPPADQRPTYFTKVQLIAVLADHQADPGLADDLRLLSGGETTDDLELLG